MNYYQAKVKNANLSEILSCKREEMCGVGTRKVKLYLNKLIKEGDKKAEMYRKALEIEDANIMAKRYFYYADTHYETKKKLINELIDLCEENDVIYGVQETDDYSCKHKIYFELPNCQQISFHNTFDNFYDLPKYKKEWDGQINSTLNKLEEAILFNYGDAIKEKYLANKKIKKKKEDDI